MRATIHDVAREAGVSITTVHRALNNKTEISPETLARVIEAAEKLQYIPNSIARALASGDTKTLGAIITDNTSPVFAQALRGIEAVTNAADMGLFFCNSANSQEQALRCLSMLQTKHVEGIIITPVQADSRDIQQLQESKMPFVLLFRHFDELATDYVVLDNRMVGYLATQHLIRLGHRHIGHIAGPAYTSTAQGRLAGYRQALAEANLAVNENLILHEAYSVAGGYAAAQQLLSRSDRPSAIFAAYDLQAVGVIKAAKLGGLRIPQELALVGADNIELSEFLESPLTTVTLPAYTIGTQGAEILLGKIRGESTNLQQIVLKPELIIRNSCGASSA